MDKNMIEKITEEVISQISKGNENSSNTLNTVSNTPQGCGVPEQLSQLISEQMNFMQAQLDRLKNLQGQLGSFGISRQNGSLSEGSPQAITNSGVNSLNSLCDPENCTGCGYCVVNNMTSVQELIKAGAMRIGAKAGIPSAPPEIARFIDHTLLKPDTTAEQIIKLCKEAKENKFMSVCINPTWVSLSAKLLKGTDVKVCTVIGFPLGATPPNVKAYEARMAIQDGAQEIDMVINIGALKSKNYSLVEDDIKKVVQASQGKIVKVILETALLNDEEKIMACTISKAAGAHFVKTSTGFGPGGATAHDIALMRKTVGDDMGVKASGGVRDAKTAMEMINAGATRIGASASVAIVTGGKGSGNY